MESIHPPLGRISDFSLGYEFGCALNSAGKVQCWGYNNVQQLDVPEGTYSAIFTGSMTACATDMEGELTCWGYSGYNNITDSPDLILTHLDIGAGHICRSI